MTNAERRAILEGAQERTYAALAEVDAWDATTVNNLLHNIAEFDDLLNNNVRFMQKDEQPATSATGDPEPPAGAGEVKGTEGDRGDPAPESAPENTEEPPPEAEPMTKDEVKAKLLELSNQCDALDIAAVMDSMGYSKLSEVPAAQYAELLRRTEAVVKELS